MAPELLLAALVAAPLTLSPPDPGLAPDAGLELVAAARSAPADAWPECRWWRGDEDPCPVLFLNVTTRGGNARLFVDETCRARWQHDWGRPDAHQTIRQWLHEDAAGGAGDVCLPLARDVDEIRVTSLGGHCGYEGELSQANLPGPGGVLEQGGRGSLILTGCHARIADQRFGGIALRFADAYGFGDSYAEGHFYGVYDGFGARAVGGTGASVFRIADFNAFHYRVEILAGGRTDWISPFVQENDR